MSVFKPTYKDKRTGKKKTLSKWWVELRDPREIVRRFPAFTDKGESETLERNIKRLVACKQNGQSPNSEPALVQWLNNMPEKLRQRFIEVGLLDANRAVANKPLSKLLDEFEEFLQAKEREPKYIRGTIQILRRLFGDCRFEFWSQISANKVERYLKGLRDEGMSYGCSNQYLRAAKTFCGWMVKRQGMTELPLAELKPLDRRLDPRHTRRILQVDELMHLLETTRNGPTRFGMTGYERYLLYRLAIETGLRANEIRSLTVGSFNFDPKNPSVEVQNVYTKNKKSDVLPLRADTTALLQDFFRDSLPGVKAFGGTCKALHDKTSEMIQADLKDAGIPYELDGRYFDFHSLRHQTGSLLAASGCHPKTAQKLMRHSTLDLTMMLYTHTLHGQESEAVNKLPDLSLSNREKEKTA